MNRALLCLGLLAVGLSWIVGRTDDDDGVLVYPIAHSIRGKYEVISASANLKPRKLPVQVTPPASIGIVIKDGMPMPSPADEQV
jgi:hypothetical protein